MYRARIAIIAHYLLMSLLVQQVLMATGARAWAVDPRPAAAVSASCEVMGDDDPPLAAGVEAPALARPEFAPLAADATRDRPWSRSGLVPRATGPPGSGPGNRMS